MGCRRPLLPEHLKHSKLRWADLTFPPLNLKNFPKQNFQKDSPYTLDFVSESEVSGDKISGDIDE